MIDPRIESSSIVLGDWPLSRVFLKNNQHFPWLILVPRHVDVHEIVQLSKQSQYQLMDEMSVLSSIVKAYFKPHKLNVGALGNSVPQLHIHVIARYEHDELWPQGVWQAHLMETPYEIAMLETIVVDLKEHVHAAVSGTSTGFAFCEDSHKTSTK